MHNATINAHTMHTPCTHTPRGLRLLSRRDLELERGVVGHPRLQSREHLVSTLAPRGADEKGEAELLAVLSVALRQLLQCLLRGACEARPLDLRPVPLLGRLEGKRDHIGADFRVVREGLLPILASVLLVADQRLGGHTWARALHRALPFTVAAMGPTAAHRGPLGPHGPTQAGALADSSHWLDTHQPSSAASKTLAASVKGIDRSMCSTHLVEPQHVVSAARTAAVSVRGYGAASSRLSATAEASLQYTARRPRSQLPSSRVSARLRRRCRGASCRLRPSSPASRTPPISMPMACMPWPSSSKPVSRSIPCMSLTAFSPSAARTSTGKPRQSTACWRVPMAWLDFLKSPMSVAPSCSHESRQLAGSCRRRLARLGPRPASPRVGCPRHTPVCRSRTPQRAQRWDAACHRCMARAGQHHHARARPAFQLRAPAEEDHRQAPSRQDVHPQP
eukprot:scaffold68814_cov72-Phaeocystis_antarctica.AAC.4